jgi:hypothetical protein
MIKLIITVTACSVLSFSAFASDTEVSPLIYNSAYESPNKYKELSCDEMQDLFKSLKKKSLRLMDGRTNDMRVESARLSGMQGKTAKIKAKMKAVRKAARKKECEFTK